MSDFFKPPCGHRDAYVGSVAAINDGTGIFWRVPTCSECSGVSAVFVESRAGAKAGPLETFEELRQSGGAA